MKIKAAVVSKKSGKFDIEQLELSDPQENEILVRIASSGICHTDLGARDQHIPIPLPTVLGHEGAGIVEKVGTRVTKVKPGDHVVLSFASCGTCPSCRSGHEAACFNFFPLNFSGSRLDGSTTLRKGDQVVHGSFFCQSSFANYALANERNAVKVRDDIPIEMLGPLGCGVQTGTGAVMNSLQPQAGASIAIFGTGSVGMSAILGAVARGCTTIIAVDLHPDRLELTKELGATHTINAGEVDPVEAIQEITGGGAEFSLECVGDAKVLRQAVDALTLRGVCGLIGAAPGGMEVSLDMHTLLNERTVFGIRMGEGIPDLFIPKLIDLYHQGRLPFDRMITYYPFDDINKAVEDMEKGRVIKPVLKH